MTDGRTSKQMNDEWIMNIKNTEPEEDLGEKK
jgi:hypothetical protein